MSFTANTAQTHILVDHSSRLVAKFMYFTDAIGAETDVLKVNAESLAFRTFQLTVANTANAHFKAGDKLIGQTSGATAFVSAWYLNQNNVIVTNLTGNTAFNPTENVLLQRTQALVPLAAQAAQARELQLEQLWFNIYPGTMVELEAGGVLGNGAAYFQSVATLSGSGYYGKNNMAQLFTTPTSNPTGNFYITTHTVPTVNLVSYTIVADFRKTKGYMSAGQ